MVRGVGGVCDMCMCLARGWGGRCWGECVRGLGLCFTNPGKTWGKWIYVCILVAVVWVVLGVLGQGLGGGL